MWATGWDNLILDKIYIRAKPIPWAAGAEMDRPCLLLG